MNVGFIVTICIMSCAVLFFFGMGVWQLWRFHNLAPRCRQVDAKVLSARIEIREREEEFDPGGDCHLHCPFAPVVEYEYEVEGKLYTSKDVSPFDETFSDRSMAERRVKRYRPGQMTTAFYDPTNPVRAFLSCGPYPYLMFGLGLFGIVMIVLLCILGPLVPQGPD